MAAQPNDRVESLKQFVSESPDDPLPRYGLAMEYRRLGQLEASDEAFREIRARFPDYLPQYLIHGQVLEGLGRPDAAREAYTLGLAKAEANGEAHAARELEAARDAL